MLRVLTFDDSRRALDRPQTDHRDGFLGREAEDGEQGLTRLKEEPGSIWCCSTNHAGARWPGDAGADARVGETRRW